MAWKKIAQKMVRLMSFASFASCTHFPKAVANIEEFLTMIAGGLAGASPHMISATVTAISRLVFEFKGQEIHWLMDNLT